MLIPATYKSGREAPFTMEVVSDSPVSLSSAPQKRPPGFDKNLAAERKKAAQAALKGGQSQKHPILQKRRKKKMDLKNKSGSSGVSLMKAKKSQMKVVDMYAGLA